MPVLTDPTRVSVAGGGSRGNVLRTSSTFDPSIDASRAVRPPGGQSVNHLFPSSWSPDARFILYSSFQNDGGPIDLMVLPMTGDRKPFPFVRTPFDEQQAAFSPDGKWVAYSSNESGRFEVYVRPFLRARLGLPSHCFKRI